MHVRDGGITTERLDPRALGLAETTLADLTAADLDHAAAMVRGVIDGTERGPARDMTLVNAAAALIVADAVESIEQGMDLAAETIDDGRAARTLQKLIRLSGS